MNNSKIVFHNQDEDQDEDTDRLSILQKTQGSLVQIVEAINRVEASEDWQKLKRLVLDGVIITLERQLKAESLKAELVTPELYRLQGQLTWAKKYADLKKLSEFFRQSIENVKLQLNEQKNPRDGAL